MSIATEAIREFLEELRKMSRRDMPGVLHTPYGRVIDDAIDALTEHESEWDSLVEENMEMARMIEEQDER